MLGMPGTARETRSVGWAVTLTTLLAVGSSAALAQSPPAPPTQDPSSAVKPSEASGDASQGHRIEPPKPTPTSVSLFDPQLLTGTRPTSVFDSRLPGVEMKCIACPGFPTTAGLPQSTSSNAPWLLHGTWQRQTSLGVLSTGFAGVRNSAVPLYTAVPLGSDYDQFAAASWRTSAFAPSSQWYLTAAIEKTLRTRADGTSLGVTADVLIPIDTDSISAEDPRIGALTSRTLRFGIVVRW
jgi:hypothetical protein